MGRCGVWFGIGDGIKATGNLGASVSTAMLTLRYLINKIMVL